MREEARATVQAALAAALLVLAAAPAVPAAPEPVDVVVSTAGIDDARLEEAVRRAGGSVVRRIDAIDHAVVRTASPEALERALDVPVHRDVPALPAGVPDDPHWDDQWGPKALDMPRAWDLENGTDAVRVAVVDSGIAADHEDLRGAPMVLGPDLVDGDGDPDDERGHGTMVAGVIGAARDNAKGVAGMASVELYPVRAIGPDSDGSCIHVTVAVVDAVVSGADVVNLSLRCLTVWPPLEAALDLAAARDVLVVAAAGNAFLEDPTGCPAYPASSPTTLAVGALDPGPSPASYSCRGPHVEVAAPGTRIRAPFLQPTSYASGTGTSFAVPHVTGAAALVASAVPDLPAEMIRALLVATADDVGPAGPDPATGAGMVDPVEALEVAGAPSQAQTLSDA